MPNAKRLKSSAEPRQNSASSRPTTDELEGENEFSQLAREHWLKTSKRASKVKVKNDVLKKDIWDALEKDNFPTKSLLILEGLQTLER
jgi:intron-binding protein aquarius